MTTAKEIADALRTATTYEATRPLVQRICEREAIGAPAVLEDAIMDAFGDVMRTRERLAGQLHSDAQKAERVGRNLAAGYHVGSDSLCHQTNYSAVVYAEHLSAARTAFDRLLSVFAAIGDRIEATPEEQAKAAADRAERETVTRRTAWEKLPAAALRKAAAAHGISYGSKADTCAILAERGLLPASE